MSVTAPPLGGMSAQTFLREYWQRKPLLIRQAFPQFRPLLSATRLKQLARQNSVPARLVLEQSGGYPWQVLHSPLRAAQFKALPETHWGLLVQDLDKVNPCAAALLAQFWFIPQWLIDDLMISLAPKHGSVGAHVDSYDVFLLQAQGRRRWQISRQRTHDDDFIADLDLRILKKFTAQKAWVLYPGDMLYLPAGVAHHGVALESNMTYSIGFRAPTQQELVAACFDDAAQRASPHQRLRAPLARPAPASGCISRTHLRQVRQMVRAAKISNAQIDDWFARYTTETRHWLPPLPPAKNYAAAGFYARLRAAGGMSRSPAVRCAYIPQPQHTALYLDGHAFVLPKKSAYLAPLIADALRFSNSALAKKPRATYLPYLREWYHAGYLCFGTDHVKS